MARPLLQDTRVALLIDADNIPANNIDKVFDASVKHGRVVIKRAYGDWSKTSLAKWLQVCNENAIRSVQLNRYVSGKNTTDLGMLVDAMDMMHNKEVDVFVLASSDSDFTSLAIRLKESGVQVIGIGERKTPLPFVRSCDHFVYLESASVEAITDNAKAGTKSKSTLTDKQEVINAGRELLIRATKQAADEDGTVTGSALSQIIRGIQPSFNLLDYGVPKLSDFLKLYSDVIKPTGEKSGEDPIYQINDKVLRSN